MKLFCLPYAGGSAVVYSKWTKKLEDFIELYPVELAGRGKRFNEPFYDSMEDAVNDIFNQIKDHLNQTYAFFGHSMGSLLVYELCQKIKKMGYPEPSHIFFSGREAPQTVKDEYTVYDLPDEEFIKYVFHYGGMPESFLENKMLLDIFIPILKADFKIVETYQYIEKDFNLNCDFSILSGEKDQKLDFANLKGWEKFTIGNCTYFTFEGGHFYINEDIENTIACINKQLKKCVIE
ncbi:thioesterase [Bacillus thuringiensis]|nr:thioesterase [Bacillus thuringiensis]